VDDGKTIDHQYYIDNCLTPIVQEINRQRPKSGMKILHVNARPHVHKDVINFLESNNIKIIPHPPFHQTWRRVIFGCLIKLKQALLQTDVTDAGMLKGQITAILKKVPKEEYLKTFQKYLERLPHCINNQGDYFEHLIK